MKYQSENSTELILEFPTRIRTFVGVECHGALHSEVCGCMSFHPSQRIQAYKLIQEVR